MKAKIGHYILALLFFSFAAVQINDPDPYLWIVLYSLTAFMPLLYTHNKLSKTLLITYYILIGIVFCFYIPDLQKWIQDGMPSITSEMKATTQYIENVREALGLVVCLILVQYYFMKIVKK